MDSIPRVPGVYIIRNLINGHIYVGSSINLYSRKINHFDLLNKGKHGNIYLQRAFNKYGKSSFSFDIIELIPSLNKEDILSREQFFIDTLNPQYNLSPTAGSNLGFKHSPESLKKRSKRGPHTLEARQRMSLGHRKNPIKSMLGKKHSPETIELLRMKLRGRVINDRQRAGLALGSEARIGTKHSEESRQKMSLAHRRNPAKPWLGKKRSEETKTKISIATKGRMPPNKGKKASEEARAKMSAAAKRRGPNNKGKPSPLKGIPRSEETKRKMIEGRRKAQEARLAQMAIPATNADPIDASRHVQLSLWEGL